MDQEKKSNSAEKVSIKCKDSGKVSCKMYVSLSYRSLFLLASPNEISAFYVKLFQNMSSATASYKY